MNLIEPKVELMTELDGDAILHHIEKCGRTCYRSTDLIKEGSAEKFIEAIIKRNHLSVLEHYSFTVKWITDRAIANEITRHRIASYSQESSRYCNYGKDKFGNEIKVIKPSWTDLPIGHYSRDTENFTFKSFALNGESFLPLNRQEWLFLDTALTCEENYLSLLDSNAPEDARAVLPLSLATELVMTANFREWRHFFKLRCDKAAHPEMRQIAMKLLSIVKEKIPIVFDDLIFEK